MEVRWAMSCILRLGLRESWARAVLEAWARLVAGRRRKGGRRERAVCQRRRGVSGRFWRVSGSERVAARDEARGAQRGAVDEGNENVPAEARRACRRSIWSWSCSDRQPERRVWRRELQRLSAAVYASWGSLIME